MACSLRVLVLYVHPLFGQGIAQLLRSQGDLDVTCLPASEDHLEEIRRLEPHTVVIESGDGAAAWEALPVLPPMTVIRVALDEDTMEVYQCHQVVAAGPDNLIAAIRAAGPIHS
jgi:DNA-binding NarL/FixJ family response regulator